MRSSPPQLAATATQPVRRGDSSWVQQLCASTVSWRVGLGTPLVCASRVSLLSSHVIDRTLLLNDNLITGIFPISLSTSLTDLQYVA